MNIPIATYRVQFNAEFTFDSACEALPYLKELGISHIYAAPILKAKKGSMHGYDVVDHSEINPELGGREKFNRLMNERKALHLSWIQDIVPNHMTFDSENKLLMDIFEKGPASQFYNFFDIDWGHPYVNLKGRALTPFLGEFYGTCLDKGELILGMGENGFFITYYDLRFPLCLASYPTILKDCFGLSEKDENNPEKERFLRVRDAFQQRFLDMNGPSSVAVAKSALWQAYTTDTTIHDAIDRYLGRMNSGTPEARDALHTVISAQLFRPSFWKVGNDELNYRRFFTVNSLICLKTENTDVFDHIHAQVFHLMKEGHIDGLRIDHIDGLYAPLVYMRRLRERAGDRYLIAEKILCENEEMPTGWPIQGMTGYDFLNYVNGIFVDTSAARVMKRIYVAFSGIDSEFEALVVEKKRLFMGKHMAGDIDNLAHLLKGIFSNHRHGSDFTMYGLRRALVEIMAHFPVYRTYVSELGISDSDKFYIKRALHKACRTGQDLLHELNAVEKILLLNFDPHMRDDQKEAYRHFTRRFQQFSGVLMAKGAEDTAFYIYNRLISLNEVGGFPGRFGITADEFHAFNAKRLKERPHSMNATATHDTKRGEDIRIRIDILSEMPSEWQKAIKRWHRLNRRHKTKIDIASAPCNNDEYFIYQTLAGAFPFSDAEIGPFTERMKQYIVKAVREAKIHTGWLKPDTKYEESCIRFIERILNQENNPFLLDFIPFQRTIAYFGIFHSISQIFLKLTSPGVPDIYQGTELWDFNLVDPDNRRKVDFEKRKNFLNEIKEKEGDLQALINELWTHKEDGRIKLFALHRLLKARGMFQELFEKGEYLPLPAEGIYKNNILAFARKNDRAYSVTVVPRFLSRVIKENTLPLGRTVWQDTAISLPSGFPRAWNNAITGKSFMAEDRVYIGNILEIFPAGLFTAGHNSPR